MAEAGKRKRQEEEVLCPAQSLPNPEGEAGDGWKGEAKEHCGAQVGAGGAGLQVSDDDTEEFRETHGGYTPYIVFANQLKLIYNKLIGLEMEQAHIRKEMSERDKHLRTDMREFNRRLNMLDWQQNNIK